MFPGRRVLIGICLLLVAAVAGCSAQPLLAPSYTSQSIVHAATQTVEALAPNTIATIYGTNLAFDTVVAGNNVIGASLPQTLDGVTVIVQGLIANLFFVSPTQINFLVPYDLTAGSVSLFVARMRRDDREKRLASFWELPARALFTEIRSVPKAEFTHQIVNDRFRVAVWKALDPKAAAPAGGCWFELRELASIPVTTITRKALTALSEEKPAKIRSLGRGRGVLKSGRSLG